MNKTNGLFIIVWVFIPIRPKLLSRICRFDQNSSQKVLPCRTMGIELWLLVWRVERLNSWSLAILLVEYDGFSTFGHNIKWPSKFKTFLLYPPFWHFIQMNILNFIFHTCNHISSMSHQNFTFIFFHQIWMN